MKRFLAVASCVLCSTSLACKEAPSPAATTCASAAPSAVAIPSAVASATTSDVHAEAPLADPPVAPRPDANLRASARPRAVQTSRPRPPSSAPTSLPPLPPSVSAEPVRAVETLPVVDISSNTRS